MADSSARKKELVSGAKPFLLALHNNFENKRQALLKNRKLVWDQLKKGEKLDFRKDTANIREDLSWKTCVTPADIQDRRVEITGPAEAKMTINALNSGAKVFMADFEDSLSPTWENIQQGQETLFQAVRKSLSFVSPQGKTYALRNQTAVLMVRPRGLHLTEAHSACVSASLFDFGTFLFHNAKELLANGSGPYFYLPKLESYEEALFWRDVFRFAENYLELPSGSIKVTVLIETITAAFQMEEILFALKDYIVGLNAGRWDYIFSLIKKFHFDESFILPDRAQVTMAVPFMRAYSDLLVKTCHKRGAHAMGGMAAFIPSRKDAGINGIALAKVREDKLREASSGFDGTWVAHPDLVPIADEIFTQVLGAAPNQKTRSREDVKVKASELLNTHIPGATVTEQGIRNNINVSLQYLEAWLSGTGAAAIHNLMEDAATAEISRAQLWQWLHFGRLTAARYRQVHEEELSSLVKDSPSRVHFETAGMLLEDLVFAKDFPEFLTTKAYEVLISPEGKTKMMKNSETSAVTTTTSPTNSASHANGTMEASVQNGNSSGAGIATENVKGLAEEWKNQARWQGVKRDYTPQEVLDLRPSIVVENTLAKVGAERLWKLLHTEDFVPALGALSGAQAVQMVKAGLKAIYMSGWQVAADANMSGQTYPDQSLYPSNSVPQLVKRLNNALTRADQAHRTEMRGLKNGSAPSDINNPYWYAPIIADAEAGFGGPLHAFELMKSMIEAGASGVHFEDQLASEKKCGHLGGKVLVPTSQFVNTLASARLASDVLGVPTVLIARTDSLGATLLTSDVDPRDHKFITGKRTSEGYFFVRQGIESAVARALAYAPYADLLWFETSKPDLGEAREFAKEIHAKFPGKLLAYNCSPSFNWKKNLDDAAIRTFQTTLAAMGYKFQFITLAGWHLLNFHTFDLARNYKTDGMSAYVDLQEAEFASEKQGYTATKHQREVGTAYFDQVLMTITGGQASTSALSHSTEAEQFH